MSDDPYELLLVGPGPRPPFRLVSEHLWGADADVDSDGNSAQADSTDWTELTLTLRPAYRERIDIDPVEGGVKLALRIKSNNQSLARQAADFLLAHCGGRLTG